MDESTERIEPGRFDVISTAMFIEKVFQFQYQLNIAPSGMFRDVHPILTAWLAPFAMLLGTILGRTAERRRCPTKVSPNEDDVANRYTSLH